MAVLGNLEAVILRKQGGFLISIKLLQRGLVFLIMDIGEALEDSSGNTLI
ncbi:MAG: hypothetical protein R3F31_23435 [Verrucomicrobiales bacterium]